MLLDSINTLLRYVNAMRANVEENRKKEKDRKEAQIIDVFAVINIVLLIVGFYYLQTRFKYRFLVLLQRERKRVK